MNKVILMGRLTRIPEVRYTAQPEQKAMARYTLAVDRIHTDGTDFISCVAFGKNGEFAEKYLKQGTKIVVCGHLQTGSYTDKDGRKIYTTDVYVEDHYFAERAASSSQQIPGEFVSSEGYEDVPFR